MKARITFLNSKQIELLNAPQKVKCIIAPRRWGKNYFSGVHLYRCAQKLPKCGISFVGPTIESLLLNTLPSCEVAWKAMGLIEGYHYVKFKQPPKSFASQYFSPSKFNKIISWRNGAYYTLYGTHLASAARGGTDFALFVDEGAQIDFEGYQSSILPRLSGSVYLVPKAVRQSQFFHSQTIVSSAPPADKPEGEWLYMFGDLQDQKPEKYLFYNEKIYDNEAALGREYLQNMREQMGENAFAIEFENQRGLPISNCYYYEFCDVRNTYLPKGFFDPHYNRLKPLHFSFDFNDNFKSALMFQPTRFDSKRSGVAVQKEFFTENELIRDLAISICEKYKKHNRKLAFIGGDPNGRKGNPNSHLTYFDEICEVFESYGWDVVKKFDEYPSYQSHAFRYEFSNQVFSEKFAHLMDKCLAINSKGCPNLIKALKLTPVKINKSRNNRVEKDKRAEKKKSNQALAPHLTDCLDYGPLIFSASQLVNRILRLLQQFFLLHS